MLAATRSTIPRHLFPRTLLIAYKPQRPMSTSSSSSSSSAVGRPDGIKSATFSALSSGASRTGATSSLNGSPRPPRPPQDAIEDGDPITVPSLSASLVLIAPLQERTADGYDYRVLLLKRNARSTTFFSAHVFPGGNLDPIDRDQSAWTGLLDKIENPEEAKARAVKLCALREAFEECGVLLLDGEGNAKQRWIAISDTEKKAWRNKVYKDGKSFVELFKFLSADDGQPALPALSSLQYRANWITPANMKRRFDTHFFISILPPSSPTSRTSTTKDPIHSEHIASADGGETVSADWLTPKEAIDRTLLHAQLQQGPPKEGEESDAASRSLILFPPQFYLVAELVRTKSWKELVHKPSSGVEKGVHNFAPRHIQPFEPEVKGVEDSQGKFRAATVLIGDPEHSKTDQSTCLKTDRHRTYVLLPAKRRDPEWKVKPPLGLTVMGCHREGMGRLFGEGWDVTMREGDTGETSSAKRKFKL
ncbi:BQ5605_C005g03466 [Microbotryum silenes-dioicae]|uniref:BQ5605_C005g03466 protein n=1 Tax=Microbotryum silenes-dioicae TaxID=796604 RepID=A0A2X0N4S2_9BASI|nr:BQ5605_C005g03466 [Microbotryum silenes-dioicae]